MMEMESIQRSQTEGNLMLTDHNTLLQQFIRMFSLIITWVFLRGFVLFWARISCYRSDGHQIHNLPTSDPKLLEFHLFIATIMLNLEFSHNKGKSWNTEDFALNLTPSPSAMKFYGSKHLLHILSQPQIILHVKVINCDIKKCIRWFERRLTGICTSMQQRQIFNENSWRKLDENVKTCDIVDISYM